MTPCIMLSQYSYNMNVEYQGYAKEPHFSDKEHMYLKTKDTPCVSFFSGSAILTQKKSLNGRTCVCSSVPSADNDRVDIGTHNLDITSKLD